MGFTEFAKLQAITKIFNDAYKSPLSLIVLDDIERLIEFIHIGPRFSNTILQALLVLIKKNPPRADRKLMIIGTTSMKDILQNLEVVDCFNVCLNLPPVHKGHEVSSVLSNFKGSSSEIKKIAEEFDRIISLDSFSRGVPIKTMLLATALALEKNKQGDLMFDNFMDSLANIHSL